jgi:hypothetical protein
MDKKRIMVKVPALAIVDFRQSHRDVTINYILYK